MTSINERRFPKLASPDLPSSLPESVMPAEVFNPNPIIFTPTKGIVRKSELLAQSLWIDEPIGSEDETGAPELIDTDEIFGKLHYRTRPVSKCTLILETRSYSFNIRSRTP